MMDQPHEDAPGHGMDPTVPSDHLLRSGRVLGPYVLRERIGEGGMGEVWRAEQTRPIRRTVALKLIKPGMDSREITERFRAERQALAMMDHPCIAKVFDAAATPAGRPYFAMEYVPGIRITEYCDERYLDMRDRLQLFQRVCEAVQHAHQKAILHRDLKPSNILVADVDGRPQPKIIDFGVAKATGFKLTEHTMYTGMGQLIGTPEYISPEQADFSREDVDTRTDVYSLGVILYELLAGVLPFDRSLFRREGLAGIVRLLRDLEPPRPSTRFSTLERERDELARHRQSAPRQLVARLQGDLDWIVMRCLEKDRNRRYGSALDLSRDIQRHLDHVPVEARPPSVRYRARKFVRRHQLGVGISISVVLVLIAFLVTMAVQSMRIAAEKDRASQEAALSGEVTNFLVQLFEIADPRESRGSSITAREILDRGAERMSGSEWADPSVQSRLLSTMGMVYSGLGLHDEARDLYEQALELNERHLGANDPRTLKSRYELATSLAIRGDYGPAEKILREVLAEQEKVLAPTDPATARTAQELARLLRNTGRPDEAEPLYLRALGELRSILGDHDPATAEAMNQLGILYWSRGRYEDAEPLLVSSLATAEDLLGPDHPTTLSYRNNMAAFEHTASHWKDVRPHRARAEQLYRECIETQRRVLGPEHPETLRTIYNLGSLLVSEDRLAEALPLVEEAAAGRSRVLGESHRATLLAQVSLANIWRRQGDSQKAEELLLKVLASQRKILDLHHREIRFTLSEIYEIRCDQGRLEEARPVLADLLEIERHDATGDDASAEEHNRLAWTLVTCEPRDLRDPAVALEHAGLAVRMSDGQNPEFLRTLARAQSSSGDLASARTTIRAAINLLATDDPQREEYEAEWTRYGEARPRH